MNIPSIQKLLLFVLIGIMFIPYGASSLRLSEKIIYNVEIVAFVSWYITSLVAPLILKDWDTAFILWYITFVLVAIAIGSDIIYRITRITPALWYDTFGRLTPRFYSFLETLVLLVMPGCVLFLIAVFGRRVYWKSEDET
ncbi:MAG: hypothetical protein JSV12_06755 [Candidatus Bathyarchaeota archaeon]|nr:MAG: hypothetical protein JSV12_06755 [Candidatus Bathyarchaeota archaeon]